MKTFSVMATGREGQKCTHFYVDGRRESFHYYDALRGKALANGSIECMWTEIIDGRIRHHSVFRIND